MTSPLSSSVQTYRTLRDRLLTDMPELADDPECLFDTLEGITDTKEQLAALVRSAMNDEALLGGIDVYLKKLADRKAHFAERAKRKRAIALHYMIDLNLKNLTVPDLTVTRRLIPPSVMIIDETKVPDEFMRIKKEPNKTAIKNALFHGEHVPGTAMSNGSETLAIKV
jgi:Mu-like prophage host-nuclease inhibitor protein Gam